MSITIYTNGHIDLDGKNTGLGVSQGRFETELYRRERIAGHDVVDDKVVWLPARPYLRIPLPHKRYVLSYLDGNGRNPGRDQFEADVRALLATPEVRALLDLGALLAAGGVD